MTSSRRDFLHHVGLGILALNLPVWARNSYALGFSSTLTPVTEKPPEPKNITLQAPDENGVMLPKGFTSKILIKSKDYLTNSRYAWHGAPDGGTVFSLPRNDGWIYVSNAELPKGKGGVGALQFDRDGRLIDSYPILSGTTRNCAGGAIDNRYWLSCEEYDNGMVWVCDPRGNMDAYPVPEMGVFKHEAAAHAAVTNYIYLTEDQPDGGFYRFRPNSFNVKDQGRLLKDGGTLQIATGKIGQAIIWQDVPEPERGTKDPTRYQVKKTIRFNGGEGAAYHQGRVYFATKGDNRVWVYDTINNVFEVLYDRKTSSTPNLSGCDNITLTPSGDILVAEDGGNNELVALTRDGFASPILRLIGHDQSELTGPAFSPDGQRLYFSSQRGHKGRNDTGITFEISGDFKSL